MSEVAIKPELIQWAIMRAGLDAAKLLADFPKINLWTQGKEHPSLSQLENFSQKTHTPLGYFFLNEPPNETPELGDFRTVRSVRLKRFSTELLDTINTVERRKDWFHDYLVEIGQEPLAFVGSAKITDDPTDVGKNIRAELRMSSGWHLQHKTWKDALDAFCTAIDRAGIIVVSNSIVGNNTHRKLDPEEFRGFVMCDNFAPFIFLNSADSTSAQMFTLAHELAHIWLQQWTRNQTQFKPVATSDFASGADAWLIAHARRHARVVVTMEASAPNSRTVIKIPDVCSAFKVRVINCITMLEELNVQFG